MAKLEAELNWTPKKLLYPIMKDYYEILRKKPSNRKKFLEEQSVLYDQSLIFYKLSFKKTLLYLGKTSSKIPIYDRVLNRFHDGLRKILLFYPSPKEVEISCAIITRINEGNTDIILNGLEKTLINESKPEFNISAKKSYNNKFDEYSIHNIGDFSPLKADYKWKK